MSKHCVTFGCFSSQDNGRNNLFHICKVSRGSVALSERQGECLAYQSVIRGTPPRCLYPKYVLSITLALKKIKENGQILFQGA
jgi:hypothetical protein